MDAMQKRIAKLSKQLRNKRVAFAKEEEEGSSSDADFDDSSSSSDDFVLVQEEEKKEEQRSDSVQVDNKNALSLVDNSQ